MKNVNECLNELLVILKNDYVEWMGRVAEARGESADSSVSQKMIEDLEFFIEEGRNYYKILKKDRSQTMVAGFVCKKDNDKKGFKVGDLLKAASYNAPATNFTRGSVFDLDKAVAQDAIRWTGIQ